MTEACESKGTQIPVYIYVVWHCGLPELDRILTAIREKFIILKQFDVTWRPKDYVKNFAAFYGWKSWGMWVGKKRRSGTGVFRVIIVRDEHPVFKPRAKGGEIPELRDNQNVSELKYACRRTGKHSNILHAAVNEAETRHNLRALTGETLEEFLAREDLDGLVAELKFDRPMPYVAYPYAEENGKGPRFFQGKFKLNRVELFFLPMCGVPTVFSFSFRIFGAFSMAFCIGKVKVG